MSAPLPKVDIVAAGDSKEAEKLAQELAAFFSRTVLTDASYISHGEYFAGLSPDGAHWTSDLEQRYQDDFQSAFITDADKNVILAGRDSDDQLVAAGVATLGDNGHETYWVIEDMAVAPSARRQGYGAAIIQRFMELAKDAGAKRILLESGLENHSAHALFESEGFKPLSKVFMRPL